MNKKVCNLWPSCSCYSTLELWARELQDGEREKTIYKFEQLEWAETTIFLSLACIGKFCPDIAMKMYARRQLEDTFWSRQKALSVKGWQ